MEEPQKYDPDSPSFATRGLWLFVYNKEICNPSMIYYGFYLQNYLFCVENAQPFTPRCKRGGVWGNNIVYNAPVGRDLPLRNYGEYCVKHSA